MADSEDVSKQSNESFNIDKLIHNVLRHIIGTAGLDFTESKVKLLNINSLLTDSSKELISQEFIKIVSNEEIRNNILNLKSANSDLAKNNLLFSFSTEEKALLLLMTALRQLIQDEMKKDRGKGSIFTKKGLTKAGLLFGLKSQIERRNLGFIYLSPSNRSNFLKEIENSVEKLKRRDRRTSVTSVHAIGFPDEQVNITQNQICLFWYFRWFLKMLDPEKSFEDIFRQEKKKKWEGFKEIHQQLRLYLVLAYLFHLRKTTSSEKNNLFTADGFVGFIFNFSTRVAMIDQEMQPVLKTFLNDLYDKQEDLLASAFA